MPSWGGDGCSRCTGKVFGCQRTKKLEGVGSSFGSLGHVALAGAAVASILFAGAWVLHACVGVAAHGAAITDPHRKYCFNKWVNV